MTEDDRTAGTVSITLAEQRAFQTFLSSGHLPPELESGIEQYIQGKTGKPWDDASVIERMRRAIVAQKTGYWKEGERRRISYQSGYSVIAYLAYHFPVYYFQSCHLIGWLAIDGLLRKGCRCVDLGSGPGVVPLAFATVARFFRSFEGTVLPVEASEEHREACRSLVTGFLRNEDSGVRVLPALAADLNAVPEPEIPENIDLLVLSNLLNELPGDPGSRAKSVMRWAEHVSEDGVLLLVEPADLVNATGLREVQRELTKNGLHVHHPCRYLWGSTCAEGVQCWTFEERPSIRPTKIQAALASGSPEPYRYLNTDLKFSAALLRRQRPPRLDCPGVDRRRLAPLSQLHRHVGRRIACTAAVMSADLGDTRNHLFKLCDGSARRAVFAVLPSYHVAPGNRMLLDRRYGEVVLLRDVLVRENPKTHAYNLLVQRSSTIESCRR
jgi:hypothetical protein